MCFAGLAANNVLLFIDLSVVTAVDLRWARRTLVHLARPRLDAVLAGIVEKNRDWPRR